MEITFHRLGELPIMICIIESEGEFVPGYCIFKRDRWDEDVAKLLAERHARVNLAKRMARMEQAR